MNRHTPKADHNVVQIPARPAGSRKILRNFHSADFPAGAEHGVVAAAGSPGDPRMREALRLAKAFLAIEDAEARHSLVVLAERLVSHGWLLREQKR